MNLGTQSAAPVDQQFAQRRRPQPPEALAASTIQWLATLPSEVRPRQLPIEFTRIANAFARCWGDRRACIAYFDDLLVDRRGTRRGFPMAIMSEIASMKNHFESVLHPMPQTAWDDIVDRYRNA
jgi:hypothetical protein